MKHDNDESNKSEQMDNYVKTHPELAAEWSVEKHTPLIPINYRTSSFKCVWVPLLDHEQKDYETS